MGLPELRKRRVEDDIYACAQCGFCHEVCPIYEEIGWESASPRGKIYWLKHLLRPGPLTKIKIDPDFVNRFFQCTICGHCQEICQTMIDTPTLWKAVRTEIYQLGLWPGVLKDLSTSVEDKKNVYNMPNDERNIWAMDIEETVSPKVRKKAKVAYFVGCVSSFMGRLADIPISMMRIMDHAKVDFTILGPEEWCCGDPLFLAGAGAVPLAENIARHNVEKLRELGIETLIATCAGCYRAWKQEYPEVLKEDFGFEVLHASEFLAELVDKDKLRLRGFKGVVTYHDPCEIGRHCNIYEEPRKVLESIPKISFIELPKTKKECRCCGGGGLLKATNPELAIKIASKKLDETKEIDAKIITSACPACRLNISDAIEEQGAALEMLDIIEIVARALSTSNPKMYFK